MKYVKMIGLAAVAAMALMAFAGAGTASAADGVICSTATTPCNSKWANGTAMEFSLKSGTSANLTTTEGATLDTCTGSTVSGSLTANGSSTTAASGSVATGGLTWSGCTVTTATTEGGTLTIETNGSGTGDGTVFADGFRVTTNTALFGSCVFTAGTKTHLGTFTEGKAAPETPTATLDVNAVVERVSGLCPLTAKWVATYVLTKPTGTTMYISGS